MNISITSSSNHNNYASVLIYMLKSQSYKPTAIICIENPKYQFFISRIKLGRFIKLMKKIFYYFSDSQSVRRDYLRDYAQSNNIIDWDLPLSKICDKEGVEFKKVRNINSVDVVDYVKQKKIDVIINAGGGIFKIPIINAPKIGILNAHMGSLPRYRGINVMEWSLFYNHTIGVTLHFIERGIDEGDILLFKEIRMEKGDTIDTLRSKSQVINIDIIIRGIELLRNKGINRVKQLKNDGKQYYAMHPRLKRYLETKLSRLYK